jgi:hypothetical protein
MIGARWFELAPPATVRLHSARALTRAVERHRADVALAHDVLDRQVVDSGGIQLVRAADVYLVALADRIELVAIEVGIGALLRRLGPARLRRRVRPARVIAWASVGTFAPALAETGQRRGRRAELAGEAGAGLALGLTAARVKRLRPSEIEVALRASQSRDG